MATVTVQTGAEKSATELAGRLRAAGWEVRMSVEDSKRYTYPDGRLMIPTVRNAFLHADGPRSIGCPYLSAHWSTVIEETEYPLEDRALGDTKYGTTDISFYGQTLRPLATEAELATWLDALLAVAAGLDA